MMIFFEWVFWLASFLVIYPYVVYPLILEGWRRLQSSSTSGDTRKQTDDESKGPDTLPTVTLIVSAFNEEAVIGRKLDNSLLLDYPAEALDIIIVSDGSTDRTAEIVEGYAAKNTRIRLLSLEIQSGKSAGLNQAVPLASGEIIVFSDANAMYEADAVRRLVQPFSNAGVGYTVGSALYHDEDLEAVNVSEGLYWKYELWIKLLESAFYSVVGGDGAIYAIRRELFEPLDAIDISDFVNPIQIVAAGYRGVFLSDARSFEGGMDDFSGEFRRKRRIVNRSWGAVRRHFSLFSPIKHFRFLFMIISHKVIRWWSVAFVALALTTGAVLAVQPSSGWYPVSVAVIAGSLLLAILGKLMDKTGMSMPKIVYLPYYFYLVGLASLLGIADDFRGRSYSIWTHTR